MAADSCGLCIFMATDVCVGIQPRNYEQRWLSKMFDTPGSADIQLTCPLRNDGWKTTFL